MRLIVGNWKAGCPTAAAAAGLATALASLLTPLPDGVSVAVCPPFTTLAGVRGLLGDKIGLGAQDVFWEDAGAFTGEITPPMLTDLGCSHALVGHSERRHLCGETDATVARKVRACWRHRLLPIVCVGETLEEREAGRTAEVLLRQVGSALAGAPPAPLVVAYEPVWAIGTGRAAQPGDCAQGLEVIRQAIASAWSGSPPIPCLYGGSVTPDNCRGFWTDGSADGALVGGASLDADVFARICRAAGLEGGSRP